jgi:hypothetical protein
MFISILYMFRATVPIIRRIYCIKATSGICLSVLVTVRYAGREGTGGKGGRCVGLTTLPPSCADCLEIWVPQPPGILRACSGL